MAVGPKVGCRVPAVAGLKLSMCQSTCYITYSIDVSLDEETRAVHGVTVLYVELAMQYA